MEDIERYGDYNEIDEAPGEKSGTVVKLLKLLVLLLCFSVVGILAFRVILFNYYPKSIKNIYFNDTLTAHYESVGDDFRAKTQSLRAPYDDPDFASFFCDNLIVIEDAGQLQLSVRYNSSIFDSIKEKYGVELDADSDSLFTFALESVPREEGASPYTVGELDYSHREDVLMYTYYKLVFDGVAAEELGDGAWIRLKITLNGVENAKPYYVLVYENTEEYDLFGEYKLKAKERPQ